MTCSFFWTRHESKTVRELTFRQQGMSVVPWEGRIERDPGLPVGRCERRCGANDREVAKGVGLVVRACLRYGCVCCENGWEWMPRQGGVGQPRLFLFSLPLSSFLSLFSSLPLFLYLCSSISFAFWFAPFIPRYEYTRIHTYRERICTAAVHCTHKSVPALVLLLVTEGGFKLRVVWKSVVRMIKDSRLLWTRPAATLRPFDAIVGEFGRWSALIARLPNELDRLIPHGTTYIVRFLCEQIHSISACMRWTFLLGGFFLSTSYVDILPRNQFDDTEIVSTRRQNVSLLESNPTKKSFLRITRRTFLRFCVFMSAANRCWLVR